MSVLCVAEDQSDHHRLVWSRDDEVQSGIVAILMTTGPRLSVQVKSYRRSGETDAPPQCQEPELQDTHEAHCR